MKHNIEEVGRIFNDAGCLLLEDKYINIHFPMKYRCECGNISQISLANFMHGVRCMECGIKKVAAKRRHDFEFVKQYFEDRGCKLLEDHYINNKTLMTYQCICGNISQTCFNRFSGGHLCDDCGVAKITGENSYKWNPELSDEDRILQRNNIENAIWRKQIFERDNYQCILCGIGGQVNAHHLDGWNWCKEKRYVLDNGVTLCEKHHIEFHHLYGKGLNTKEQFGEFILLKQNQLREAINQ